MPDKMTADELNRRLAEALGWKLCSAKDHFDGEYEHWAEDNAGETVVHGYFEPATSVDDLRDYVLPEIVKRFGRIGVDRFQEAAWTRTFRPDWRRPAMDDISGIFWSALTASPAVLAEAALEVLEGKK